MLPPEVAAEPPPSSSSQQQQQRDPAELERIKAAARAYAFSTSSSSEQQKKKKKKRKVKKIKPPPQRPAYILQQEEEEYQQQHQQQDESSSPPLPPQQLQLQDDNDDDDDEEDDDFLWSSNLQENDDDDDDNMDDFLNSIFTETAALQASSSSSATPWTTIDTTTTTTTVDWMIGQELDGLMQDELVAALPPVVGMGNNNNTNHHLSGEEANTTDDSYYYDCTVQQYQRLHNLLNRHLQLLWQQVVLDESSSSSSSSLCCDVHSPQQQQQQQQWSPARNMLTELRNHRRTAALFQTDQRHTRRQWEDNKEAYNLLNPKDILTIFPPVIDMDAAVSLSSSCREWFRRYEMTVDERWFPFARSPSELFVHANHNDNNNDNNTALQQQQQRNNRFKGWFTTGQDNLVLRGVNAYGEKQWDLVARRLLPDQSVHAVAQRYGKLCTLLYEARGVKILKNGNEEPNENDADKNNHDDQDNDEKNKPKKKPAVLVTPPKHDSIDDVDMTKAAHIKAVPPPAVLNVHRWTLQEDVTILQAVPIFGTMWAEIAARFLPHRDRGHLRKRYLVLERRIKASLARDKKNLRQKKPAAFPSPVRNTTTRTTSRRGAMMDRPMVGFPVPKFISQQAQQQQRRKTPTRKRKQPPRTPPKPPFEEEFHNAGTRRSIFTPWITGDSNGPPTTTQPASVAGLTSPHTASLLMSPPASRGMMIARNKFKDEGSRAAFETLVNGESSRFNGDESRMAFENIVKDGSTLSPLKGLSMSIEDGSNHSFGTTKTRESDDGALEKLSSAAMMDLMSSSMSAEEISSPRRCTRSMLASTPTRRSALFSPQTPHIDTLATFPTDYANDVSNLAGAVGVGVGMFDSPVKKKADVIEDGDLEAVSALNSLSHSPKKQAAPSKKPPAKKPDGRSLFAKVTGKSQPLKKKRKLEF